MNSKQGTGTNNYNKFCEQDQNGGIICTDRAELKRHSKKKKKKQI